MLADASEAAQRGGGRGEGVGGGGIEREKESSLAHTLDFKKAIP